MKHSRAVVILAVSQVFYLIFTAVWAVFFGLSVMMFDSTTPEESPGLGVLFYTIMVYPGVVIATAVISWICYVRSKYTACYVWNAVPLLWVIPIIGLFTWAIFFA